MKLTLISLLWSGYLAALVMGLVAIVALLLLRRLPLRIPGKVAMLGILLGVGGIVLIVIQTSTLRTELSVQDWPQVTGTVISSKVIGVRAYRPNIVYEYKVGDTTYRDSTSLNPPSFGNRATKEGEAETLTDMFKPGQPVTVHYNPQKPSESKIRTSPDWSTYGKMGLGATLFGLGVFCLLGFALGKR